MSTPTQRRSQMRAFVGSVLVVAFVAANAAFIYAFIFLDKPLETVGTAAVMSLINFSGIAVGYYLGSSEGSTRKTELQSEL